MEQHSPPILAIGGFKNTGKTTVGVQLMRRLSRLGYKVGVIKHDGHDFEADIPDTDSHRYKQAGAAATAVFSPHRLLLHKEQENTDVAQLLSYLTDMDLVLIEGLKSCDFPRIEVLRKNVSEMPVCNRDTLLAMVADFSIKGKGIPVIQWGDWGALAELVCSWLEQIKGDEKRGRV